MTTDKQDKVDRFLEALKSFVSATISYQTTDQEMDSMGAWHEEKHLRWCLEDLLGMEPRREDQ